mgnify:CR=1 FL=1
MNRRAFLQQSALLGALALAGCTTDGSPAGSGDDTDTPTETPTTTETLAITETTVETTETSCSSGAGSAVVSVGAGTVEFSGRLTAPTPCYEVVVESTDYDAKNDELVVFLGVEDTGEVCIECVGSINFEGNVSFEGKNPSDAAVRYDGGVLASTRDGVATPTPAESPKLVSTSFELRDSGSESVTDEADVRFDTETETVVVTGLIPGKNGCMTAALGAVDYDSSEDVLSLDVVTRRRDGTEDQMCTEQILPLPYEGKFSFEGGFPTAVAVSHDGEEFLTAAHSSATAEPAEE